MSLCRLRLVALLLPAALLLHEGAYALSGEAAAAPHGYLELLVPAAAALCAAVALATALAPLLGAPAAERARRSPLALAAALVAIFTVQELAEVVLLGGGAEALAAALASAWLLLPLGLGLGAAVAVAVELLGWAGERLAELAGPGRPRGAERAPAVPSLVPPATPKLSPLAFGLARRPPPVSS